MRLRSVLDASLGSLTIGSISSGLSWTTESVMATVIYKVDPNNITSTITRHNNATLDENHYTILDATQWNAILSTTGVTVENGTPHFNYVTTVYTAPGAPLTVSSTL